jgi:hypothetical protein
MRSKDAMQIWLTERGVGSRGGKGALMPRS